MLRYVLETVTFEIFFLSFLLINNVIYILMPQTTVRAISQLQAIYLLMYWYHKNTSNNDKELANIGERQCIEMV